MSEPFFSIITPVYNIEHLLTSTIRSALEQTFEDWEMILVDDGSPDNAGKICDEYAIKDNRIKVIHKKNAGLAAARNTGLKVASGKYFIILEGSDQFYGKETLQKIYEDLCAYPSDIYFGLLQDKMEKTGEITNVQKEYCVSGYWREGGAKLVCKLYDCNDILALSSPVNKVFKREFVKTKNLWFYEGIYHDDDEWIPRTIAHCKTAYFTNKTIYNALTWDGCLGGNVSEKGLTKKAIDKMLIAEHCCDYFYVHFHTERQLLMCMNTYYSRMYLEGISALNVVRDYNYRNLIYDAIYRHRRILKYMRHTESWNLNLLAKTSRIFGINYLIHVIKSRYK